MRTYTLLLLLSLICQLLNAQNVGIGTTTPAYKLTVQTQTNQFGLVHTDGGVTLASYIGTFQGALGGWLGTRTNHPLNFFTNNSAQQMTLLPNGNVGIGTINPTNKLQINGATPGFTDYDFAIGRNAQTMAIYQGPNFTNLQSTANISLNPQNGNGYVGINVGGNPANKLQIGTLGPAGFTGNDLAIGNGTNAMVVSQSNTSTLIASTTDIVLLPRYGSTGRVGINTSTPRCPLEIGGYIPFGITSTTPNYAYFALGISNFQPIANVGGITNSAPVNVSIYASDRIVGLEFNAFSDARIKNMSASSNSAADLAVINALQIRDYTMKDMVKYGNKPFKKIIAQEVEKIYPQIISKHTDFIPNVYQVASKIEKTGNGYLLTFANKHNINTAAKKLRILLAEGHEMEQYEIASIANDKAVEIKASDIKGSKIFVYGEEVDDFRTVDYEGLTTLNISATQELSKQLKKLQQQVKFQQQQIMILMSEIRSIKRPSNRLTSSTQSVGHSTVKKSRS